MLIFLGIILFILLVVVHEFGHMVAAKKKGVVVEEFGIGFPPKAKTLTVKDGTEYTLNWLPLGGFVRLKGEHDSAKEKGSYGAATFRQKALIIFAGIAMNWITAAVIFTIVALMGMPQLIENQFVVSSDAKTIKQEVIAGRVEKGSPAESIGLEAGDRIIRINNQQIDTVDDLLAATQQFADKKVEVSYRQNGISQIKEVRLRDDAEKGNFGVAPGEQKIVRSTWSAPIVGVGTTAQFTAETYKGLATTVTKLFTGEAKQASDQVAGPVGIVVLLNSLSKQGLVFILFLIGTISIALAVMNSLPIPALDGGRLFVTALFRTLKKPLTKETEEKIHGTGMMVLLLLFVLITVVDVQRIFAR